MYKKYWNCDKPHNLSLFINLTWWLSYWLNSDLLRPEILFCAVEMVVLWQPENIFSLFKDLMPWDCLKSVIFEVQKIFWGLNRSKFIKLIRRLQHFFIGLNLIEQFQLVWHLWLLIADFTKQLYRNASFAFLTV